MRARLALLACLALAACGGGTPASTPAGNQMGNALLDPATEIARRWGTVFTDATVRMQAARDMGYVLAKPSDTTSAEQIVTVPKSPIATRSTLQVVGTDPKTVDRYVFRFAATGDDGRDTGAANDVDKIPARVMLGFLQRFEVQPDDEIKVAVRSLKPIHKALPGATIDFVPDAPARAQRPRNRSSVLTITRPGVAAPAPTPSPTQSPARK